MSLIIRQKRGALQLSINAIVVLILAITMLGLGLGFMRSLFGQTEDKFKDIAGDLSNTEIEAIQSSNAKLTFLKNDLKLGKSEKKSIYYGIKNVDDTARELGHTINCTGGLGDSVLGSDIKFSYFSSDLVLESGETKLLKMEVSSTAGAVSTSYDCNILVQYASDLGGSITAGARYTKENFFVTLE